MTEEQEQTILDDPKPALSYSLPTPESGQRRAMKQPIGYHPDYNFGRPVVRGTGVGTAAIAARFRLGETMIMLAKDYNITMQNVEEALRFEMMTPREQKLALFRLQTPTSRKTAT